MAIPQAVLAEGWIPFTVILVVGFRFFIRFFPDQDGSHFEKLLVK